MVASISLKVVGADKREVLIILVSVNFDYAREMC
jgi:hypothetical protein